jgi:hypothetical protein
VNPTGPELRDIHVPADPSWWPPAPGWWLLAAIVIAVLAWMILRLRQRMQRRQWRQRVIAELDRIATDASLRADPTRLLGELSQLLRRSARLIDVAAPSFRGTTWLAFLDQQLGGDEFSRGAGRVLLDGPYQRHTSIDVDTLLALVRRWLMRVLEDRGTHV